MGPQLHPPRLDWGALPRGGPQFGGSGLRGRGCGGVWGGRNANELFWERGDLMKEVYALGLGEAHIYFPSLIRHYMCGTEMYWTVQYKSDVRKM